MPLELDDDMGFVYIAEETSPDMEEDRFKNLIVHNEPNIFFVEFDACLHTFEVINRNNRQYLMSNIEECIRTSEKLQTWLQKNAWYGEKDHPAPKVKGEELTPQRISNPDMDNCSHKILRPTFRDNALFAHIQTCAGFTPGKEMAGEIIQGLIPSFSCRALATLKLINGKPTVIVRKLITYDWVLYPSHADATMVGAPQAVRKGIKTVTESVKELGGKLKRYSEDIMIPLKEIMEYVGHKDPNTQLIMESFDLDVKDMVGFDETRNHAIIKDNDSYIYAKISPNVVHEVHDFYRSFSI